MLPGSLLLRRTRAIGCAALVCLAAAGCGSDSNAGQDNAAAANQVDPAPETSSPCAEPSGQEKLSLRSRLRDRAARLRDEPWARVLDAGTYYMAAEIDNPSAPRVVVVVSFPEKGAYVGDMRAINARARRYTNLPVSRDGISSGAQQAYNCLGS